MIPQNPDKKEIFNLVKNLYKNDKGWEFKLTPSQIELFEIIFRRKYRRNHIITYTQFGKSVVTALAVLTRISSLPEKWTIVAPTEKKAKIIMNYIIKHIFDNEYTKSRLEVESQSSLERLRRERSKSRLTFKVSGGYGEVMILSAQGGRTDPNEIGNSLMGFGSPNVIEDESALIEDIVHAKVMRMLGGYKDNFLVKIGNPFRRNHFLRSYLSDKYHKFIVDYRIGLEEGRLTQDFIDEMREEPLFDILYACEFPPEDMIDYKGWMSLLSENTINQAMSRNVRPIGRWKMGVDVAKGGDENVFAYRCKNYAFIKHYDKDPDIMNTTGKIKLFSQQDHIPPSEIYIDETGLSGVADRLNELGYTVNPVVFSRQANERDKFYNIRAEMYWKLKLWLEQGGTLQKDEYLKKQLLAIKYKVIDSNGKIQIISKDKIRATGLGSPDRADALALTFYGYDIDNQYIDDIDYDDYNPKYKSGRSYK